MRERRGMASFLGIYQLADCAKLLHAPRETVREWTVKGLAPSRKKGQRISPPSYNFADLVSLLVVRELRRRGIPLQRIRKAEEYLRGIEGFDRPLATKRLYTAGRDILFRLAAEEDHGTHLVAATRGGQTAIEEAFESVLSAVHYDEQIASYWLPWEDVQVTPERQFGAPCVFGTGIQTATLYGFYQAGDQPEFIAQLYSLPLERVERAIAWENSLASQEAKAA